MFSTRVEKIPRHYRRGTRKNSPVLNELDHADLGGMFTFLKIPVIPEILRVQYTTLVHRVDVANVPTLLFGYICTYKLFVRTHPNEKNVTPAILINK